MTPPTPWLATFVNRWHSGASAPYLAHTNDRIGGHSGRMGILALHYWPDCSRDLLVACLTHDMGEYMTADVPAPAKTDYLRAMLDDLEAEALSAMGITFPALDDTDQLRLKFLDRIDAYLWADHHAPQLMIRADWLADLSQLLELADAVGVELP